MQKDTLGDKFCESQSQKRKVELNEINKFETTEYLFGIMRPLK